MIIEDEEHDAILAIRGELEAKSESKEDSIERESDEWDYEVKERQTAKMEELAELGTYVLSNITEFDAYISNGRLHAGREPI
jgi:putative heme iron utilization protein